MRTKRKSTKTCCAKKGVKKKNNERIDTRVCESAGVKGGWDR